MKVALIEAGSPGFHVFSGFTLPRLGLPILGAILRNKDHEVKIFCEDLAKINWNYVNEADLVGISTITNTAERAYEIAKRIKKQYPDKPLVMGGTHVTFLPDEALDNGVDLVVRGEGEATILEILEWLEDKRSLEEIAGVSYKVAGKHIHNPDRPQDKRVFDHIPCPALDLIEGYEKMKAIPIQTSRGCNGKCNFCSVIAVFGRNLRFAEIDPVIQETEKMLKFIPGKPIFYYDDNFINVPERTKKILRGLIELKKRYGDNFKWSTQVTVKIAKDPELVEMMRQAGCNQVFMGLESVNQKTLESCNKGQNLGDMKAAIEACRKANIAVHGMFILGFDDDDLQTVKDTVRFAIKMKIDTVMFSILTPLPGAEIYYDLESQGRLLSRAWRYYDSHHVVFEPAKIPAWQLQKAVMLQAMPRFYSWGRMIKRALSGIFSFRYTNSNQRIRRMILTIYGHITVRKFKKQKGERKYLQWLRSLPRKLIGAKAKS